MPDGSLRPPGRGWPDAASGFLGDRVQGRFGEAGARWVEFLVQAGAGTAAGLAGSAEPRPAQDPLSVVRQQVGSAGEERPGLLAGKRLPVVIRRAGGDPVELGAAIAPAQDIAQQLRPGRQGLQGLARAELRNLDVRG